jgi:hypothetical protein
MAVDDILLVICLNNILLLLWLSRLLLLRLNRLQVLARGTTTCQLSNSKVTSSALVSSTMNVNHLQFRNR